MTETLPARALAAPALATARDALAGGPEAWLVGGAVRDALLGREVVDADLAIAGDEQQAARAIAKAARGHAFELSAEFGTWRVVARDHTWQIDASRMRGASIEEDLAQRDFTVNAIALPLAGGDAGFVDPGGGIADLRAGRLRAASPRSFADDPLRVLRAARLAAQLGFEVEPQTAERARENAAAAAVVSGERQFAELRLLFQGPDPVRALGILDDLGATAAVLPEIETLRGVEQNPNHHLDVHGHTIEVLSRLLEVEGELARYAGDRAEELEAFMAEPLADAMTRLEALRLGALVHDVGKPATRGTSGGYVTFIGHDSAGAEIVERLCRRLRTSRALGAHLAALTRHHLRLGFLAIRRPLQPRAVHEYLRATQPVTVDVTLLSVADRLAARGAGPVASEEMVAAHLATAREMIAAALDWNRVGPPVPLVRGDELARELGIEPGPELGRVVGELEAAQYAGEVASRDEAIAVARRVLGGE